MELANLTPPDSGHAAPRRPERERHASGLRRKPASPLAFTTLGNNTGSVSAAVVPKRLKGAFHNLLDDLRPFASKRCAKCCRVRIAPNVAIQVRDGRAHYHGIMRCGLVWECPVCQLVIKAARAAEVRQAVEWHTSRTGRAGAAMVTVTIRHNPTDDLAELRRGVANAWRRVQSGREWQRQRWAYGIQGYIRALEVTYGRNGWHPHLHTVFLSDRPLDAAFGRWIAERWAAAVERELGAAARPDRRYGCDVRPLNDADYLAKLGLEIAAPHKSPKGGNLTPLQIAHAFVSTGDLGQLAIWRAYCDGMKGARMLTWSRHLKRSAGILDKSDEDIIAGEDAPETTVAVIKGVAWDAIRDVPGIRSEMLAIAEETPELLREWLGQLQLWPNSFCPTVSFDSS